MVQLVQFIDAAFLTLFIVQKCAYPTFKIIFTWYTFETLRQTVCVMKYLFHMNPYEKPLQVKFQENSSYKELSHVVPLMGFPLLKKILPAKQRYWDASLPVGEEFGCVHITV